MPDPGPPRPLRLEDGDRVDLLVVGGGVFGLWAAKRAVEAGLSAALVEARRVGAGASGGVLGALTAHTPDRWNAKKQFQFNALVELPTLLADLEQESGRTVGYRRCGRLIPIRHARFAAQVAERAAGAERFWRAGAARFVYEARRDDAWAGWLAATEAAEGYVWDTLAARVDPARYLVALKTWLAPRAAVCEGAGFVRWDGAAQLSDGRRIAAGAVVLAAGYESFPMIAEAVGRDVGGGVKGQAAVFALPAAEAGATRDAPMVFEDGVYVVPHDDGRVAVGASSEKTWAEPDAPTPDTAAFLARAQALCPRLGGRDPVRWWAGVRPKCWARDPIIGRLPGPAPLFVMTGGFKISFGVAHRAAAALMDEISTRRAAADMAAPDLPESFRVAAHLA